MMSWKKMPGTDWASLLAIAITATAVSACEGTRDGYISKEGYQEPSQWSNPPPPVAQSASKPRENKTDGDVLLAQVGTGDDVAQAPAVSESPGEYTQEQINEMINNPLGELWILFAQNDTVWYDGDILDRLGEDKKVMNTTLIQPVLPMQLTENWKAILRPTIPINSFDVPDSFSVVRNQEEQPIGLDVDFDRKTGLGDIVLWSAFAKNNWARPPNVFGFGPTVMLDTATDDVLGTGKWSAGPMALALHIGEKWIYGAVAQHWWSFAGDDDRADVNLTDIQYVLRYRLTPETNIGFGPNIRYNWDADSGERLSLPVGLGFDTMIKIGSVPAKIGVEFYYFVEQPDAIGPQYQFRFVLSPVVPSPSWSKKPIF
jgi:hypothetical protein